jgi:hypothetical protein
MRLTRERMGLFFVLSCGSMGSSKASPLWKKRTTSNTQNKPSFIANIS